MKSNLLEKIKSDIKQATLNVIFQNEVLFILEILMKSIFIRTIRVILNVRLSQSKNRIISKLAKLFLRFYLIDIGDVVFGRGVYFPHPQGIIISSGVKIGSNVHIGQHVTIGGNFKRYRTDRQQRLPIIGDRVMIQPGAVIGGPVIIGDDVIIGANSVVTRDVPSNSMVYGQNIISPKRVVVSKDGGAYEIMETA